MQKRASWDHSFSCSFYRQTARNLNSWGQGRRKSFVSRYIDFIFSQYTPLVEIPISLLQLSWFKKNNHWGQWGRSQFILAGFTPQLWGKFWKKKKTKERNKENPFLEKKKKPLPAVNEVNIDPIRSKVMLRARGWSQRWGLFLSKHQETMSHCKCPMTVSKDRFSVGLGDATPPGNWHWEVRTPGRWTWPTPQRSA